MENLFLETNAAWDSTKPVNITYVKKQHSCFEPMKDFLFIDYIIRYIDVIVTLQIQQ